MTTIRELLSSATPQLIGCNTPRLDAEVLLAYVLGVDRAWLIAHGEDEVSSKDARTFEGLIARRLKREPVAYIVGRKEFYGREFAVTPDVLIPRPESEGIIELLKDLVQPGASSRQMLDVGCGSGCLGITAKLEMPELEVTLSDISPAALTVARRNATHLGAEVQFVHSDLLTAFSPLPSSPFHLLIANLPYVDRSWDVSPELRHEPALALYAQEQGLKLIKTLISQAPTVLAHGGYLLLEADPCQHEAIIACAKKYDFVHVETREYTVLLHHSTLDGR
ncbi:peptide chain release factor N(5)-glutamine methyltransferase [Candidatus Saccharibacteria bacterium]|nr:peptide chain release factor N(5)-glutamine methyltransferase [Candidatus Saccharibacteria bacterium]